MKIAQDICSWTKLGITVIRNRIYPISLIACLLIIVMLVVMNITPNSDNRVETYDAYALQSIIEQAQCQYNELRTEHIELQTKYVVLEVAYESAKQNVDSINSLLQNLSQGSATSTKQISDLQKRIEQLQGELPNLRVALQTATDERYTFEQRFLRSQYDNTLLVDRLENEQAGHQDLLDRLSDVNERTDITTSSNLTPEKRGHFYEMWDLWIETLKEGE